MFGEDLAFLKQHAEVFALESPDGPGRVAVAPGIQARVMTSSAAGDRGESFGWLNRDLLASGRREPHINAFGGEDRIWFGPEGGQFSVFFAPGAPFDLAHWQTPEPMDWGPWDLQDRAISEARFRKRFSLTNYSGSVFEVLGERAVRVYGRPQLAEQFGIQPAAGLDAVGFETENRLTNAGRTPWRRETGLLSIWVLGMFKPSPRTTVILPFQPGPESARGPVVNDAYFGKPPAGRLNVDPSGVLLFKADGAHRSKIGLSPRRARPVMGSYDPERGVLTVVSFTMPAGAADYVNSMWEIQKEPYAGDVSNSYNDGPPAPGQKPLGPFYELETSSPAAALAPGERLTHVHRTLHVQGTEEALEPLARKLLGTGLRAIAAGLA